MNEEEFLDLFRYTGPKVDVSEFYRQVMKIDARIERDSWERFKRGVAGGQKIMKQVYHKVWGIPE